MSHDDRADVTKARIVLAIALACGVVTLMIHFYLLPPGLFMLLRAWGLHFFAVVFACVFTGYALGHLGTAADKGLERRHRLACLVPFTFLALHELMQWLYPKDARDNFDSVRDLLLNALGALTAYWLLRFGRSSQGTRDRASR